MEYTDPPAPRLPEAPPRFWGRERTTGQLISASFGMFRAHARWLIPLAVTGAVPGLAWTLIAEDVFDYNSQSGYQQLFGLRERYGHYGPDPGTVLLFTLVTLLVTVLGSVFTHAGILGTLTAAGRGEPVSVGRSFDNALKNFGRYFGSMFLVGLRVIPWSLLFVVPGIIKSYGWLFAVPMRMAGDTDDTGEAIRLSHTATMGRKGYLFLFNFLISLIVIGASVVVGAIFGGISAVVGHGGDHTTARIVLQISEILTTLFAAYVGAVTQLGVWLAYADAVAPYKPNSPAAAYAMGVTGKPFPAPNFRQES